MNGKDPVVQVEGLRKSYHKRPVLRGVDLAVREGEAVAVIGPNGAGKSTLFGCLSGERIPDAGRIRICGIDPFAHPVSVAKCAGFLPEQPFLYGELTVRETLEFVARIRGIDEEIAGAEALRLFDLLNLRGADDVLCRELSQGMARKVAIVTVLLHGPRLIVLDEAFNGLDRPSTENLLAELGARRADGMSILLSSHDLDLLAEHCDRGLLLRPDGWDDLAGERWRRWRQSPALSSIA